MRSVAKLTTLALILFCATLAAACSRKPDAALCNRYYRSLLSQTDGLPAAISVGLKTPEARNAIVRYCMQRERAEIECVTEAGGSEEASACESAGN
jgi:hypothetical protein